MRTLAGLLHTTIFIALTEMSCQVETNLFFHFTKIAPVVCVSERRGGGYIMYSTCDYCMINVSFVSSTYILKKDAA